MNGKDKVQIYIPVGMDWTALVERVVSLREKEGKTYKEWYRMPYTTSEVVIDALEELARRIEADQAE